MLLGFSMILMVFVLVSKLNFHPKLGVISRTLSAAAFDLSFFFLLFGLITLIFSVMGFVFFAMEVRRRAQKGARARVACHRTVSAKGRGDLLIVACRWSVFAHSFIHTRQFAEFSSVDQTFQTLLNIMIGNSPDYETMRARVPVMAPLWCGKKLFT